MSRLIDADELIEAIEGHVCSVSTCGTVAEAKAKMAFKEQVLQDIEEQPTIEAEPVCHGHWIDKPTGKYGNWQSYCSACGKHSQIGGIESNRHKPRCPWCGAFMDEVSE